MEENAENTPSGEKEGNGVPAVERRTLPREKIPVKRMVLATLSGLQGDEEQQLYLHINDISEKGMRITTDIFVPEENSLRLRLLLDQPLEIDGRTVWARELGRGNYVMGIELFQDSELYQKNFGSLLEWACPTEEKQVHYLRRNILFDGWFHNGSRKFFAHVVSLSPGGMEITCDFAFPIGESFTLTFKVEEREAPLTVTGKVIFQDAIGTLEVGPCPALYRTWIEFVEEEEQPAEDLHATGQPAEEPSTEDRA